MYIIVLILQNVCYLYDMKRLVIELESTLHQEFKLQAMKNGQSLKEAVTDLVEYYVKNEMILTNEK